MSLKTAQHGNRSSETQSGIAQGTINVRDDHADLSGLDRDPKLGNQTLAPIFDAQKVQEHMEMGQVAGQVGMRTAGAIAGYMADHATTEEERNAWSDGGANKVLLHGLVGAATTALGRGDVAQGAAGALAGEGISLAMQDWLIQQGIDPNSAQGRNLMQLASAAVGAAVGGGGGATTALQGEQYNRVLHPDYVHRLDHAAKEFAEERCQAGQCISVREARNQLIRQGMREQDATFDAIEAAQGTPINTAARDFLSGHSEGYLDPKTGEAIDLSAVDEGERRNESLFADTLYRDPQARAWVEEATGLSDGYLANMARRDFYEREKPALVDHQADQTANETLSSLVDIATPLGPALTTGRLIYQGRYEDAAKEAGKEVAYQAAGGLIGRGVGKAVTVVKAAIKEGKTAGEAATAARDVLKTSEQVVKQTMQDVEKAQAWTRDLKYWNDPKIIGNNRVGFRKVYARNDLFDPNKSFDGLTNIQRMQKGRPPIGYDGQPVNLHHLTQDEPGSLAEVGGQFHLENTGTLHGLTEPGKSFRYSESGTVTDAEKAFNRYKYWYWQERSKEFK